MQVTEPLDGHWTDSVVPTFLAASQHQRDVFVEATSLREKNTTLALFCKAVCAPMAGCCWGQRLRGLWDQGPAF